ncbi:hypothetical protein LCGC14_0441230 [marine sediment metagenome]|uniref:Phage capsid-like C-terminal domain-containing protein n=1 Tax=marine sediment metagenome TaxID=412755 RepID=A0A0F9V7B4_9ZZZZ
MDKATLKRLEDVLRGVSGQIKLLQKEKIGSTAALEALGEEMEKRLREQIMTEVLQKLPGDRMVDLHGKAAASRKRLNEQCHFMLQHEQARKAPQTEMKALGLDVGSAGGFLVAEEFRAEVQRKLIKRSVIRPNTRVFTGVGKKGTLPQETGTVNTTWENENVKGTENTNPKFGALSWNLNKLRVLEKISDELVMNSEVDIVDLVTDLIAEQIEVEEDKVFMNGSGSNRPSGLRLLANVGSRALTGALDYDFFVDLKHDLLSQYRRGGTWLMENTILALTAKVKDSNGLPIFVSLNSFGSFTTENTPVNTVGFILGSPVLEQNNIPTNLGAGSDESEIWFTDLMKSYIIFDGGTMEVSSTTEGFETFESDQIGIKAKMFVDGKGNIAEAAVKGTAVK